MQHMISERLRQDHDNQRRQFSKLIETSGDTKVRECLWKGLKHAAAEERVFYPSLLAERSARKQAKHSVHKHTKINKLIKKVEELGFEMARTFDAIKPEERSRA